MKMRLLLLLPTMVLLACAGRPPAQELLTLNERAAQLAQQSLIVDTHIDVPYRLQKHYADVSRATADGDFDYPRARAGGLNVPFMSIYTPAELEAEGGSWQLANQLIDSIEALVGRAPDKFAIAHSVDRLDKALDEQRVVMVLGMENGSPIAGDLANLKYFFERGIRYITLAHSLSNHIADSSYDENRQWQGLSPFGRRVVQEMNRLGMLIDISHVTDQAFYQVLEVTRVPVIASHSSARHFTPGWERNISDAMIKALADNGGVVQINFGSGFITLTANAWYDGFDAARESWLQQNGFNEDSPQAEQFAVQYRQQHPYPYASLAQVVDHIDHVVKLVGVEHVGIGSDYDGVGDSLPQGLKDVASYPNLIAELLRRGYGEAQIRQILGGNLVRVWREAEAFAQAANASTR